jgi:hemin uptake protein HemP
MMVEEPTRPEGNPPEPARPGIHVPPSLKLYRSEELFAGARVVCIEHAGAIYKLQITSRGKLILQK